MNNEILSAYSKPGHATFYGGLTKTYKFWKSKYPKLTLKKLAVILSENEAYTRHRAVKREATNPYFVYYKRQVVELDLIDVSQLKKFNSETSFLISAIDCFTRLGQCLGVKDKTQNSVLQGVKLILKKFGEKPHSFHVDKGIMSVSPRSKVILIISSHRFVHKRSLGKTDHNTKGREFDNKTFQMNRNGSANILY